MSVRSIDDVIAIEQSRSDPFSRFTCTLDLISNGAAINPEAPALSFITGVEEHAAPVCWTYREWLGDIIRTANMLRRMGVEAGDVVAYVLPNLPETHLAIWGGETAGITFALNSALEPGQLAELLRAARTKLLITLGPSPGFDIWERLGAALTMLKDDGTMVQAILAVNASHHEPGRKGYSGAAERQLGLPASVQDTPVYDFHVEIERESAQALSFKMPDPGSIASYFCTGGTTGLPKIATHCHRNEISNALQVSTMIPDLFRPGKTFMACLPLFHVNAQLGSGLAAFASGSHVLLGPPEGYRADQLLERFWEIIAKHRVSTFSGVPTVFSSLMQSAMDKIDLSCLDYAICGAAPLPVELLTNFESKTGVRVLEGYGLTESSCVASLNPPGADPIAGSIGIRLPWQDMKIVVIDEAGDYMRDAETNEVGVVVISGPNVFAGYLSEEHNLSAWINIPGSDRQWLNTGDLARQDTAGYFWLTGRKKELIIRGGHNIDPKVIEEVFAQHPAVAMSAAVGRPDAHAGEVPVVYVQLYAGREVEQEELLQYSCRHIPERAAVPKAIRIVDSLPATAVGKIFKPALVMREVELVVRDEAHAVGVELIELAVEQDARRGILARYRCAPVVSEALSKRLGRYAFTSLSES